MKNKKQKATKKAAYVSRKVKEWSYMYNFEDSAAGWVAADKTFKTEERAIADANKNGIADMACKFVTVQLNKLWDLENDLSHYGSKIAAN